VRQSYSSSSSFIRCVSLVLCRSNMYICKPLLSLCFYRHSSILSNIWTIFFLQTDTREGLGSDFNYLRYILTSVFRTRGSGSRNKKNQLSHLKYKRTLFYFINFAQGEQNTILNPTLLKKEVNFAQGVADHYRMPLLLELVNWMFKSNPGLTAPQRVKL
jgi:hypothetical protein